MSTNHSPKFRYNKSPIWNINEIYLYCGSYKNIDEALLTGAGMSQ